MELSSRIQDVIFGWDMHNYILDERIDEKLEDISEAIHDNKIRDLLLKEEMLKSWKEDDCFESEACSEIARYLREQGGHLIVINTPIPRDITKDEKDNIKSWSCSGWGMYRITVIYIKSIELIRETISDFEDELFEEIYKEEQKANK